MYAIRSYYVLVRAEDEDRAADALEPGEVVDLVAADAPGAGAEFVPAPLAAQETAARYFDAGHNCAEAVLRTFASDWGMPGMVRLATGFGGGVITSYSIHYTKLYETTARSG